MRSPHIAVFGGSQVQRDDAAWAEGYAVGQGLAGAGCTLITGGYGGVMEAASQGASDAGGHTIGLTLGLIRSRPPNGAVAQELHSEDLFERLRKFVDQADACIALHGGVGTLLEIALVWNLKILGAADGTPVWVVGPGWKELLELCSRALVVREKDLALVTALPDGDAAVRAVCDHFRLRS